VALDNRLRLLVSLAVGALVFVGLVLLLGGAPQIARADAGHWFAMPGGTGDCPQSAPCHVQTALGAATHGNTIFIAGGTYPAAVGQC